MSAPKEILDYIDRTQEEGFSDEAIQEALHIAGWHKKDIHNAFVSKTPTTSRPMSPVIIIISILLFLLLGLGSAYAVFWYQTHLITQTPSTTPTPTLEIIPSLTPSLTEPPQSSAPQTPLTADVSYSHNGFGFDILKTLLKTDGENNIVLSPTSISLALSMTYNGASESTKLAMAKTLKIQGFDIQKLNEQSNSLIKSLTNPDPQVTLSIANSIWAKKGIPILPTFFTINTKYYNATIQSLDFSLDTSADTINTWVSKNTKGKIPTIVEKPIGASVVMYLINAVYFYGSWTRAFDTALTAGRPFFLSEKNTIDQLFMKQSQKNFLYEETDTFQAIQLPYGKNKRLSIVIFLPKTTLPAFLGQLTHATWNSWMKSFSEMEGTILLPKFKAEYKTSLKKALSTLGMAQAFTDTADFSGMRKQKDISISDVIHKTFIDVSEKGTEAAAATSVEMKVTSFTEPKKTFTMEVNKPFFFTLVDTNTAEILFMGVIRNPRM